MEQGDIAPFRRAAGLNPLPYCMRSRISHMRILGTIVALILSINVSADILLIGNAALPISAVSREEAVNIYMGRSRKLPDGSVVAPLDLESQSPTRRDFYRKLVGKPPEEISTYWARLHFSGKTQQPAEMRNVDDLLARIARDPQAIGYVDRRQIDSSLSGNNLKVLLVLPE